MVNLYEILQNAQDGKALDNLAKQFNISPEQADAAVKSLMPALSTAFLNRTTEPAALSSILGSLGDSHHQAAFADPGVAQSETTTQKGANVLGNLFGSTEIGERVATHASNAAGLSPALLSQMLPVIASMIMGGISTALQKQGLGGLFSQLANAAGQGGLGSILGGALGGAPANANPQSAQNPGASPAPGGILGSILGGLLGGAQTGASPQSPQSPNPSAAAEPGGLGGILATVLGSLLGGGQKGGPTTQAGAAPGLDASAIQAGLDALTKMLQPGTPTPGGQQAGLQSEISDILDGRRR
ncbi:MAG: DUF937 domain-containing protein [Methylocella sp.]